MSTGHLLWWIILTLLAWLGICGKEWTVKDFSVAMEKKAGVPRRTVKVKIANLKIFKSQCLFFFRKMSNVKIPMPSFQRPVSKFEEMTMSKFQTVMRPMSFYFPLKIVNFMSFKSFFLYTCRWSCHIYKDRQNINVHCSNILSGCSLYVP